MEQEGAMNSSEYHKCMSEVYFTNGILWMFATGVMFTREPSVPVYILIGLMVLNSITYLYRSYREFKEAL